MTSATYALARLDANTAAVKLPALLAAVADANQPILRDRLLAVLGELGGSEASKAISDALKRAVGPGEYPSAAAIEMAGKLKLAAAGPVVRRVLADAADPGEGLLVRQVHAAIGAADALKLPVRREANDICQKLWTHRSGFRLMLTDAARLLGRQITLPQADEPNVPSPSQCVRTLRLGAVYDHEPTTWPATQPKPKAVRTPLPSAAAAVALWLLDSQAGDEFIQIPASDNISLSGDYVAWHIGRSGGQRAFELGLALLPALDAPAIQRVYDDDMRATGALLLAIAAETPERRAVADKRVRSRLEGGDLGGEDSFYVRGAYQCALAILGDANAPANVQGLLETGQFSQRRAITALTLAGDLRGVDWLLWNPQINEEDMLFLLVDEGIGEVLAASLPTLPRISPAVSEDLAKWRLLILRHAYLMNRNVLTPRLRRKPDPQKNALQK